MEAFSESGGVGWLVVVCFLLFCGFFFFPLPSSFVSCVNTHVITFTVKNTKSLLSSFFSCSRLPGAVGNSKVC